MVLAKQSGTNIINSNGINYFTITFKICSILCWLKKVWPKKENLVVKANQQNEK